MVAYERFHSPWAISLVLLADLVPAMLFGPILGAAADRWSRRNCLIVSDVLRGAAFLGIGLVDGFAATVALALLAGVGHRRSSTRPSLAALPSLVEPERLPAATSLYGAITDIGFIRRAGARRRCCCSVGPEAILFANAVTFAVSALVLSRLRFGARSPRREDESGARPGRCCARRARAAALAGMPASARS